MNEKNAHARAGACPAVSCLLRRDTNDKARLRACFLNQVPRRGRWVPAAPARLPLAHPHPRSRRARALRCSAMRVPYFVPPAALVEARYLQPASSRPRGRPPAANEPAPRRDRRRRRRRAARPPASSRLHPPSALSPQKRKLHRPLLHVPRPPAATPFRAARTRQRILCPRSWARFARPSQASTAHVEGHANSRCTQSYARVCDLPPWPPVG